MTATATEVASSQLPVASSSHDRSHGNGYNQIPRQLGMTTTATTAPAQPSIPERTFWRVSKMFS